MPEGSQASRLHFRIAGDSGSQTFRLVFLQVRRRNVCIPGSRASRLQAVVLNRRCASLGLNRFFCLRQIADETATILIFCYKKSFAGSQAAVNAN
jgi:hypothetical protein